MWTRIIDIERLIHSIKAVIACMLGVLLAKLIGAPADQWIVITIIVVMCAQIYVGSVLQKAYLRFLGTIIGCLFAAITITTVGISSLTIMATIAFSTFIFSYLATQEKWMYAGTLGAVTTTIILLGQHPTIMFAAQRFLEISAGLFIATFVSQFILPIHASKHLRRAQARTLEQLRDYYITVMMTPHDETSALDYHDLDENVVKSLLRQRQLAKESRIEPLKSDFNSAHFMQSLYCEREILRSITYMYNALTHIQKTSFHFDQLPGAEQFNQTIIESLNTLVKEIESDQVKDNHIHIPSLNPLKEELQKRLDGLLDKDLIYIEGFLFSAEILLSSLGKLANLYQINVYED